MQRLNIFVFAHILWIMLISLYKNHGSYIAKLYHTFNCFLLPVIASFYVSEYCTTQMQLLILSPIQCLINTDVAE